MRLELMAARYRNLVITGCEWRAYELSDPEQMADEVFERLAVEDDPGLPELYRELTEVVRLTYSRHIAQVSMIERLRSNMVSSPGHHRVHELLETLSSLRGSDLRILQLRYWDGLEVAEIAEVLDLSPSVVTEKIGRAESRFLAKATRKHPEIEITDVGATIAEIKVGEHTRN